MSTPAARPAPRTRRPLGNLIEYLAEAWALGLFMMSACGFGVFFFHPASPVPAAVPGTLARRGLMGLAMGLTAMLNVYSPWGRRSGAHMNPATTLVFLRLGKVSPVDAAGYVAAQFAGGLAGVVLASALLRRWIAHPAVNYVVTVPGRWGAGPALLAEFAIALLLMSTVLWFVARPRLAPVAGAAAASLVALYITVEAPVSGMSMNPARTLASALPAMQWDGLWLYFLAPPAGMLAAAELHRRLAPGASHCAKYHHDPAYRCLFCEHQHRRDGREPGWSSPRSSGRPARASRADRTRELVESSTWRNQQDA